MSTVGNKIEGLSLKSRNKVFWWKLDPFTKIIVYELYDAELGHSTVQHICYSGYATSFNHIIKDVIASEDGQGVDVVWEDVRN